MSKITPNLVPMGTVAKTVRATWAGRLTPGAMSSGNRGVFEIIPGTKGKFPAEAPPNVRGLGPVFRRSAVKITTDPGATFVGLEESRVMM